jgi:hypothetical protein
MADNEKLSNAAVSAAVDAVAALLDNGYLRLYSGEQPETADTPVTDQVLLAEMRFGDPAFGAAVNGAAAANAITADDSANATGMATWFRALRTDGVTVIFDGSVGQADADLIMNSVAIQVGAEVVVSALNLSLPKSA